MITMNATGTKPMLVSSRSLNLKLIGPAGCGRSHSDKPCRMLIVANVAMIDDSFRPRIRATLNPAVAIATAITKSMPPMSWNHDASGVSTNDATTTHIVINAPTDTSNALTISALACPIAARASGIVAISRPLRLNSDRNDGSRRLVYPPRSTISTIMARIGSQRPRCRGARPIPSPGTVGSDPWIGAVRSGVVSVVIVVPVGGSVADDGGDDPTFVELVADDLVDDAAA